MFFERLKRVAASDWQRYVDHEFVRRLGDGTLPEPCFRHYFVQDYLFLIHFARAWALAAYKADDLADMRAAAAAMHGILEIEMGLHVEFCRGWGIAEAGMAATPESSACMAYTRFVLERGMAGDSLDLHVALAPCIVGYGEIGARLASDPATKRVGNPYLPWIEMYSGAAYRDVAAAAQAQLDRLAARRLTEARFVDLGRTFAQASRLEADFWQMGLDLA